MEQCIRNKKMYQQLNIIYNWGLKATNNQLKAKSNMKNQNITQVCQDLSISIIPYKKRKVIKIFNP